MTDHAIYIADGIHVQVPVYGDVVGVVGEKNETFMFYPDRLSSDFMKLKEDIAKARTWIETPETTQ